MKTLLLTVLALTATTKAQAANSCSYVLDEEAYWENTSGNLTLNGVAYRCVQGATEEDRNLCNRVNAEEKRIAYFVAFDGAEANFFVFKNDMVITDDSLVCEGIASEGTAQ
jgi:hypothetical protein